MPIPRRSLVTVLVLLAVLPAAMAQDKWPTKPIRIVVPFPAGGTSDALAQPEVRERIAELGGVPAGNTPEQFARLIDNDRQRHARLMRERGITAD